MDDLDDGVALESCVSCMRGAICHTGASDERPRKFAQRKDVASRFFAGLARVLPTLAHVASVGAVAGKTPTRRE
jgi:hypothetical protein